MGVRAPTHEVRDPIYWLIRKPHVVSPENFTASPSLVAPGLDRSMAACLGRSIGYRLKHKKFHLSLDGVLNIMSRFVPCSPDTS